MTWFVPPRVALTNPRDGMISREWFLFFEGLFKAVNGSGTSLAEDDIGPYALSGDGWASGNEAIDQSPAFAAAAPASDLDAAPGSGGLLDRIALLERAVDDLRKGTVSI